MSRRISMTMVQALLDLDAYPMRDRGPRSTGFPISTYRALERRGFVQQVPLVYQRFVLTDAGKVETGRLQ